MGDEDESFDDLGPQEGTLVFSFFIEKMLIEQRIAVAEYVKLLALDRLLLTLGYTNSFIYPNDGYMKHVRRLFGRGLTSKRQVDKLFQQTLDEALKACLVEQRKDERYDITATGQNHLAKYSLNPVDPSEPNSHKKFSPQQVEKFTRPAWVIEPFVGDIDDERKHTLGKLRYRSLEFLAELEVSGGEVRDTNPVLSLFKRAKARVDVSSYYSVAEKLIERGILEIDIEGELRILRFTELGKEYIAQLKSLPDAMDKHINSPERLGRGSSFKIIEYISENAQFVDDNQVRWLKASGNEEPIIISLAEQMNMTRDSFSRRAYNLRVLKGYLIEQKDNKGEVINLGVTQEGFDFMLRVIEKERQEEKMLDDDAIEYAVSLSITAIELAESVGEINVANRLSAENDILELTKLSEVEFEEHIFKLEKLVDRLRHEYLFENS